jgi:hypothetical protein
MRPPCCLSLYLSGSDDLSVNHPNVLDLEAHEITLLSVCLCLIISNELHLNFISTAAYSGPLRTLVYTNLYALLILYIELVAMCLKLILCLTN